MFCPNCGTQNEDGARFCASCGATLGDQPQQTNQQQSAQQQTFQQTYQQPTQPPVKPPKKKSHVGKIIGIAAAAVVVVGGVLAALNFDAVANTFMRTFSPPEKYSNYVGKKMIRELSSDVSDTYDNRVSGSIDFNNLNQTVDVTLDVSEDAAELLESYANVDLSWIEQIGLSYSLDKKGSSAAMTLNASLNGDQLASGEMVFDFEEMMGYFRVPELSKEYAEMDLEDTMDQLYYSMPYSMRYYLSSFTDPEAAERMSQLYSSLPSSETIENLMKTYLEMALDSLDSVKKDSGKLSAGGVSATYTQLKITVKEKDVQEIVKNVAKAASKDKDIKKVVTSIYEAMGYDKDDAEEIYENFKESLESAADNAKEITLDHNIYLTVWVDNGGAVRGIQMEVEDDDGVLLLAFPESGSKVGFEFSFQEEEDEYLFIFSGSAKKSGDKLSGTYMLEVRETEYLEVELRSFDMKALEKGNLSGGITLTPTADLAKIIARDMLGYSAASSMIKNFSFAMDFDVQEKSFNAVFALLQEDDPFITLTFKGTTGTANKIASVKDALDVDEWMEEIQDEDAILDFIDKLYDTDIPEEYLDELREIAEYGLGQTDNTAAPAYGG